MPPGGDGARASQVTALDEVAAFAAPDVAPFDASIVVDTAGSLTVAAAAGGDTSPVIVVADEPAILGDGTISIAAGDGAGIVEVASLDEGAVETAGFDVVGFRLSSASGSPSAGATSSVAQSATPSLSPAPVADPLSVEVAIDYSSFRYVYGGEWAHRLRLVSRPACVLTTPNLPECASETVIESTNDVEAGVLSAVIAVDQPVEAVPSGPGQGRVLRPRVGGSSGDQVYGLSAGYLSTLGSFTATPLAASSSWSAGSGMGGFAWSYPLPVPPSGYGLVPDVSMSYSSQAVDGLTLDENTQGGISGLGWSVNAGGFIERSYLACSDSRARNDAAMNDFCWRDDNASIVLNGKSSELVKTSIDDGTWSEWRLKDDPGWKVVRQIGAVVATGEDQRGERWWVYQPNGLIFVFGQRTQPSGTEATNSVWTLPVFGSKAGDPCWNVSGCKLPWRWNLDQVIDRHGNVMSMSYTTETGYYGANKASTPVSYTRAGQLTEIRYGGRVGETVWYRDRVTFGFAPRCFAKVEADPCAWFDTRVPDDLAHYIDTPTDLDCQSTGSCPKHAPSFWSKWVLAGIYTEYREDSGTWRVVDNVTPTYDWPDPDCPTQPDPVPGGPGASPYEPTCLNVGQSPQLWLRSIARTGFGLTSSIRVPDIRFDGDKFDNRGDAINVLYFRVTQIDDDLGGRTGVTYSQKQGCSGMPAAGWQANTSDCYPRWAVVSGGQSGYAAYNRWLVGTVTSTDLVASGTPITTVYTYDGDPGYRYDGDDPWSRHRTYSEPRGYASVTATTGNDASGYSATRTYNFRGLDGTG